MPAHNQLRELLRQTGPLFAPSANSAGEKPAATIQEARAYFGEAVDFYVDAGDLSSNQPSTLIRLSDGEVKILRGTLSLF
jgi:L-threonylcarbamoyladenylate synthase